MSFIIKCLPPPPINKSQAIDFGPDKSQIIRGIAIIFMITLHNNTLPEFKICVPIFTFLVGYGYSFARERNLKHGLKRVWNLLSHFWLILLGLFLPIAIWKGDYNPTIENVLENMFGLESNLNWYSWYIYFYIFAMFAMIPASRLIDRFKIPGVLVLAVLSTAIGLSIHIIPNWSNNIWLQAIQDSFICSPAMFSGYYIAKEKVTARIKLKHTTITGITLLAIMTVIFFFRGMTYTWLLDFLTVPVFALCIVSLFNIITWSWLTKSLIAFGKESMNMWFFHAIFATSCTAAIFAPLVNWIQPMFIHIIAVIIISYLAGKIFTAIHRQFN